MTQTVIEQISSAMSVSGLKHVAISSNIANRDTEGYQRLKVQFDRAMGGVHAAVVAQESREEPAASLEQDLISLSSNSAQFTALSRVLTRYFSIIGAITNYTRG